MDDTGIYQTHDSEEDYYILKTQGRWHLATPQSLPFDFEFIGFI
jgi:hypothetical protein